MIFSRFKNHKSKDKMGYLDSENFVDSDSGIFICILDRDAWKYFNHFVSLMIYIFLF